MEGKVSLTTSEKIEEAFMDCLKEKIKIEDITVAFLSEKAGIGKSTFYRHYKDIYEIYEIMIDGFLSRCEALVNKILIEKSVSFNDFMWTVTKSGLKKDNKYFTANDAVLIISSIDLYDGKVVDILYEKIYNLAIKISGSFGVPFEEADFVARFLLNGNIIPILLEVKNNNKINLGPTFVTFEVIGVMIEEWKTQKKSPM